MLGYTNWKDIRNDIILGYVLCKLALLGYIGYDWVQFHLGHGSSVLGWLWKHNGTENIIWDLVMRFYMLGIAR